MRSGGYTLHQSLTIEAAGVVKQAVSLARRRGHAQVTPLHVATAMLSSSTALLKRACLQSHSHPLQCKALELCFNVALNRLPASASSSPLLSPHSHRLPSLSNALVAAFKRAQAHQRRGSIENQQQPILALKVEIEQLVISILDDPSVSRVMREAGFSSTQVKNNVEQTVSLEKCNFQISTALSNKASVLSNSTAQVIPTTSLSHFRYSHGQNMNQGVMQNDDVMSILEAMVNKNTKNTVIVGECAASAESVVRGVIDKFNKKEVPGDMKHLQFISVPLFTLRNISRDEFELKLGELRSLVKSHVNRSGVVLYLGDLDGVSDFWSKYGEQREVYYCPVEYMIMELSRLVVGGENKRLWLMGIATLKTYAKCKTGRPSLETLWSLHPLTIPVANNLSLSLSLLDSTDLIKKLEPVDDGNSLLFQRDEIKKKLICCSDCSENFKKEAQELMSTKQECTTIASSSSRLPSWLQEYNIKENTTQFNNVDKECDDKTRDLCKKWSSICSSIHTKPHFLGKVLNMSILSTSSSTSVSSNGQHKPNVHKSFLEEHLIRQYDINNEGEVSKPDLLSNPNSSPNSASSSEDNMELQPHQFNELNSDNLKILCNILEKKIPWQRCIIPEIVSTILKCRSGLLMLRNKIKMKLMNENRQESWLFFTGADHDGKETMARELAKAVFGSYDDFTATGVSCYYSSSTHDQLENSISSTSNKRARDEHGGNMYDRFVEAIGHNPSRVFYVEDADQLDYASLKGFKRAIKDGSVELCDGGLGLMKDAIVIFSDCSTLPAADAKENTSDPDDVDDNDDLGENKQSGLLDLNIATEDGDDEDESYVSNVGILDLVDHKVVFKIHGLVN